MDCPIERRVRVAHSTFNLATGEHKEGATETVVRACGTPLFGKAAERGICDGCAKLWRVEGNRPTLAGLLALADKLGADCEFGVDDPKLGEVSTDDESQARSYAAAIGGTPFLKLWRDGAEAIKESI